MPRILLLIILIYLLYIVIKHFIVKINPSDTMAESKTKEEKIVACSQCGLHIPENESHLVNNAIVCNHPSCNTQEK